MSAEPAFLIAAVRRFLNPDAPLRVPERIDWSALLRLADAHAVTPMLYTALRESQIPNSVVADLRSSLESSVRASLAQSGELARVTAVLEERGIPAIALKGPLLSRYLYGDLGARSSGDIDLLVKRERVVEIRGILVSSGYRLTTTLHWNSNSACLRSRENELSFESPSGVSIDVHWRLVPPYFASPFDQLNVWESLTTVALAGQEIQTLAPGPLLLFLCTHGSKHMFERLGWICDITRFLMVTPDLDWAALAAHAGHAGALRQLSLGVRLAADLVAAPLPLELHQDPAVEPLATAVWNRLLAGATPPAPAIESNHFCLQLLERRRHRLRYLTGLYLTPSEAEFKALQLPPWLFSLYYPFRPIRLFVKHLPWRTRDQRKNARS